MAVTVIKGASSGGIYRRRMFKQERYRNNSAPGGLGSYMNYQIMLQGLADNTVATFATVIIPNVIVGAALLIRATGRMGDGDSTEYSFWSIAFSRIAGAASKITLAAKAQTTLVAGATGNAVLTITNVAVAGANTATQTFALQVKIARSAGAATDHQAMMDCAFYNLNPGGAYLA